MAGKTEKNKEMIFHGIPASPGIAFGEAFVVNVEDTPVTADTVPPDQIDLEVQRFETALQETEEELHKLRKQLEDEIGVEHAKILDAHRMILADEVAHKDTIRHIKKHKVNAAYAFTTVLNKVLTTFDQIEDQYLKERAEDIRDVKRRVVRNLLGQKVEGLSNLRKKAIVVAKNLTPSDTATLERKYVLAFVTDAGGSTSHAAIIARSLGIPAVVGLETLSHNVKPYDRLIVDGISGQIVLNPTPETEKMFEEAREKFREMEKELLTLRDYPAVTLDGHTLELSGNIEIADEVGDVVSHGAKGVGLQD